MRRNAMATLEPLGSETSLHRLIEDLERRVLEFEVRYEMATAGVPNAIRIGVMRETAEIAEWLMAWRTLEALRSEIGQAPVA
jgi:hypothetical protein